MTSPLYSPVSLSHLDSGLGEADLHGEVLPREDVRVVRRRERLLQLLQLGQAEIGHKFKSKLYVAFSYIGVLSSIPECGSIPSLLPPEKGLVVHVGGRVVRHGRVCRQVW